MENANTREATEDKKTVWRTLSGALRSREFWLDVIGKVAQEVIRFFFVAIGNVLADLGRNYKHGNSTPPSTGQPPSTAQPPTPQAQTSSPFSAPPSVARPVREYGYTGTHTPSYTGGGYGSSHLVGDARSVY